MIGDGLGMLERPAVQQIRRDAGGSELTRYWVMAAMASPILDALSTTRFRLNWRTARFRCPAVRFSIMTGGDFVDLPIVPQEASSIFLRVPSLAVHIDAAAWRE